MVKQALQLKELAVGEDYITLITFDMAMYEKVIQLVDARLYLTKQLSTIFPQVKSDESMEPSPESNKALRSMEIHLLLRAVPSKTTHAYIPDKYVTQILNSDDTGQKLYEDCVREDQW